MPKSSLQDEILSELTVLKKNKSDDMDTCRRAIRALSYALKETQHYYECVTKKGVSDPVIEEQLLFYWKAAAISMKKLHNKRLAQICSEPHIHFINAKYWIAEKNKGRPQDFSILVDALSNAVGLTNRENWKNPKN